MADQYTCPHCGVDLRGDPIPEEHQELYGGITHFNRRIGISDWDSIYEYECPDCSGTWPRVDKSIGGAFRTCPVVIKPRS